MPIKRVPATALPLARWADQQLRRFAEETGSAAIATLSGNVLLGERAGHNGFSVPLRKSAGGGCHLLAARDGWIALNLAREADVELLPALFEERMFDLADLGEVNELVFRHDAAWLVARGREMGLAIASIDEVPISAAITKLCNTKPVNPAAQPPLVIDLSALWAGPLCGHLLQLSGARVIKVESSSRPDVMRLGDTVLFALLNQGKESVSVDLTSAEGRAQLLQLLDQADIVIEAARPRALRQLGIDAEALVQARPGRVWITITGHGAEGQQADWVGFGDDCSVAGGLTASLRDASGVVGFVGDAIADPLTGIAAARAAWQAWQTGCGGRLGLAMSGVVAAAIADEQGLDTARFNADLCGWTQAIGLPFSGIAQRLPLSELKPLGADNARWLSC